MSSIDIQLDGLERGSSTPAKLASLRRDYLLENSGAGLAATVHCAIRDVVAVFMRSLSHWKAEGDSQLADSSETTTLQRVLQIHLNCSKFDPILGEELGYQGTHSILLKVMTLLESGSVNVNELSEVDQDALMEIQDLACEIATYSRNFPLKAAPFTRDILVKRLPLEFFVQPVDTNSNKDGVKPENDSKSETILIHQVTTRQSAQEDVGFVMWPAAVVLSRWLITNPSVVQGLNVLEIGAGCGLVGLLAARLQQKQGRGGNVMLSDFNREVLSNLERNVGLNDVGECCKVLGLDFYDHMGDAADWIDMEGVRRNPVDVILAADIICQPSDAASAANTIHDALRIGGKAFVVCADTKHRFGVDHFADKCQQLGLCICVQDVADLYYGKLLGGDMEDLTAGYVPGMKLTMFTIEKKQ